MPSPNKDTNAVWLLKIKATLLKSVGGVFCLESELPQHLTVPSDFNPAKASFVLNTSTNLLSVGDVVLFNVPQLFIVPSEDRAVNALLFE